MMMNVALNAALFLIAFPAKAGIQGYRTSLALDPRFRGEGDLVFVSDDRNQP
jgi:hypothetical protein